MEDRIGNKKKKQLAMEYAMMDSMAASNVFVPFVGWR